MPQSSSTRVATMSKAGLARAGLVMACRSCSGENNDAGASASPCSQPSAWQMSRRVPESSHQQHTDGCPSPRVRTLGEKAAIVQQSLLMFSNVFYNIAAALRSQNWAPGTQVVRRHGRCAGQTFRFGLRVFHRCFRESVDVPEDPCFRLGRDHRKTNCFLTRCKPLRPMPVTHGNGVSDKQTTILHFPRRVSTLVHSTPQFPR